VLGMDTVVAAEHPRKACEAMLLTPSGIVMLVADLAPVSTEAPAPQTADPTAALLAAKDETIASLKRELTAKDETIAAKDAIIATKDALINTIQQQLSDMRLQTAIEKGLHSAGTSHSANVKPVARQ